MSGEPAGTDLEFVGYVWHWRGPSPYYFVTELPVKDAVRRAEGLAEGDTVTVRLSPGARRR